MKLSPLFSDEMILQRANQISYGDTQEQIIW